MSRASQPNLHRRDVAEEPDFFSSALSLVYFTVVHILILLYENNFCCCCWTLCYLTPLPARKFVSFIILRCSFERVCMRINSRRWYVSMSSHLTLNYRPTVCRRSRTVRTETDLELFGEKNVNWTSRLIYIGLKHYFLRHLTISKLQRSWLLTVWGCVSKYTDTRCDFLNSARKLARFACCLYCSVTSLESDVNCCDVRNKRTGMVYCKALNSVSTKAMDFVVVIL